MDALRLLVALASVSVRLIGVGTGLTLRSEERIGDETPTNLNRCTSENQPSEFYFGNDSCFSGQSSGIGEGAGR